MREAEFKKILQETRAEIRPLLPAWEVAFTNSSDYANFLHQKYLKSHGAKYIKERQDLESKRQPGYGFFHNDSGFWNSDFWSKEEKAEMNRLFELETHRSSDIRDKI